MSSCAQNSPWEFHLPPGWKREQLKYNSYLKGRLGWQNLRADEYTLEGPYLVTSEHFVDDRIDWEECYHVSVDRYEMAPQIQLKRCDVLVMKDGAAMGKLAYVDELPGKACLNSHLLLLRPVNDRYHSRLLYYVLGSPVFRAYMEQERTGSTFFGLSQESISNFPFSFPAIAWQELIVSFLDRETAKIDALIAKKQRLIEMLQEKRTALISHAVTKGLDPSVPMKKSGIEWLGMIPANWERIKFRHAVDVAEGQVDPKDDRFKAMVLIAPNHIESSTERLLLTETADEQGAISGKYPYRPGDVIYSKIRPELRKACLPSVPGLCSADMYPLSVRRKLLPEYLLYTLLSEYFTQLTVVISERVAMPKANREDLGECYLLVPPLPEQREIVEYLQGSTAKLDALTAKVREGLEKLREYRTALISAAVTGKIDVRVEVG